MLKKLYFFTLILISGLFITVPRASRTIQESDGAELAVASFLDALVHQPGYPIYMEITTFLVSLFPDNPYHVLAVFSCICVSLSAALLFLIGTSLTKNFIISISTSLAWLLFEPTLRNAADAEVFGLHQVFVCLLVLASIKLYNSRNNIVFYTILIGLLSGIASSHHHTIILWAPLVLSCIIKKGLEKNLKYTFSLLLISLLSAITGLLPYLFLFTPDSVFVYPEIQSFTGIIKYMFRTEYGTFSMHAGDNAGHISYLPDFIKISLSAIPIFILSFIALTVKLLTRRSFFLVGILLSIVTHLCFMYNLKMPDNEILFSEFLMRFYGFIALSFAICFLSVFKDFNSKFLNYSLSFLILIPISFSIQHSLEASNNNLDRTIDIELEQILLELPSNSVFITSLDRIAGGIAYKQIVENKRKDIILIIGSLIGNPTYNKTLSNKYPQLRIKPNENLDINILMKKLKDKKVFAYFETPLPNNYRKFPFGVTWQWIPTEVRLAVDKMEKNMLSFCARYPLKLSDISNLRNHSRLIIWHIFTKPLKIVATISQDSEIKEILNKAAYYMKDLKVSEARSLCLAKIKNTKKLVSQ